MKGVHETTLRPNSTEGTNIILYQQKDWVGGQGHIFFVNLQYRLTKKNLNLPYHPDLLLTQYNDVFWIVEMLLPSKKWAFFNLHKCNISERYTGRFDLKLFHIHVPLEKVRNKHCNG